MDISFRLYKSGIYETEISLEEEYNYNIPLEKIRYIYENGSKLIWNKSKNIIINNKFHYNRYLEINGAYIWALRYEKTPIDLIIYKNVIIGFIMMSRGSSLILVKKGYENYTPLIWWNDPLLSKAKYNINHIGTLMVTTSDNEELATD